MKVRLRHFLTPPHHNNLKNSMISVNYSWFLAKNLSDFVYLPWKLHNRYCHNREPFLKRFKTLQNNNLQFCLAVNFENNIFLYWILYRYWELNPKTSACLIEHALYISNKIIKLAGILSKCIMLPSSYIKDAIFGCCLDSFFVTASRPLMLTSVGFICIHETQWGEIVFEGSQNNDISV